MDVVGLDVVLDIEKHYAETRPGTIPEGPQRLLEKMVTEGKLGVKTGSGFYEYAGR
jgi:3-hydroxybutyryl-CoA dehydrogenase